MMPVQYRGGAAAIGKARSIGQSAEVITITGVMGMPNQSEPEEKAKIIHTMADGTVPVSVEGRMVPYNEQTAICYELIVKYAKEGAAS